MSQPGGFINGSVSKDTFGVKAGVVGKNGAEAYIAGAQPKGGRPVGQVGINVPIVNTDRTQIGIAGQTDFGKGRKPNHDVQFSVTHRFP